jgi:proteic killer suppression protein
MISSFRSKGLAELWNAGSSRRIDSKLHRRILVRLDRLHAATTTRELDLPGFDCHALKGHQPTRYSIHVNGPWCLTFEFEEGDAQRVDFEQYH